MALYELRTYTLYVGKMGEAVKLYQEFGFPATNSSISGSSGTMPTGAPIGPPSSPTPLSSTASRPGSGRW